MRRSPPLSPKFRGTVDTATESSAGRSAFSKVEEIREQQKQHPWKGSITGKETGPTTQQRDPWKDSITGRETAPLVKVPPANIDSGNTAPVPPPDSGSIPRVQPSLREQQIIPTRDSNANVPGSKKLGTTKGYVQRDLRYSILPPEKETGMKNSLESNLRKTPPIEHSHNPDASRFSLTDFVTQGGKFPVLVLACDRANLLYRSLLSLLGNKGMDPSRVVVVIDGKHEETERVAKHLNVRYHVHERTVAETNKEDKLMRLGANRRENRVALRIASGYFYAIQYALETAFPDSPGVVVVEDDMLYSPDFYEYFHAAALAVDIDETIWLASAWNDNGFRNQVRDLNGLRRTNYFPGLGWLLPRKVWTMELKAYWPVKHWDHWLRSPERHKGRDVLHPEVPRDYHAGVKGSFMDSKTHKAYFKYISMADDVDFSWFAEEGIDAMKKAINPGFALKWEEEIKYAKTLKSLSELDEIKDVTAKIFYKSRVNPNKDFHPIAAKFGIWHEPQRCGNNGVLAVYWKRHCKIFLINVLTEHGDSINAENNPVFTDKDFRASPGGELSPSMFTTSEPPKVYSPLANEEEEFAAMQGDVMNLGIHGNYRHGLDLVKKGIRGAKIDFSIPDDG